MLNQIYNLVYSNSTQSFVGNLYNSMNCFLFSLHTWTINVWRHTPKKVALQGKKEIISTPAPYFYILLSQGFNHWMS